MLMSSPLGYVSLRTLCRDTYIPSGSIPRSLDRRRHNRTRERFEETRPCSVGNCRERHASLFRAYSTSLQGMSGSGARKAVFVI